MQLQMIKCWCLMAFLLRLINFKRLYRPLDHLKYRFTPGWIVMTVKHNIVKSMKWTKPPSSMKTMSKKPAEPWRKSTNSFVISKHCQKPTSIPKCTVSMVWITGANKRQNWMISSITDSTVWFQAHFMMQHELGSSKFANTIIISLWMSDPPLNQLILIPNSQRN